MITLTYKKKEINRLITSVKEKDDFIIDNPEILLDNDFNFSNLLIKNNIIISELIKKAMHGDSNSISLQFSSELYSMQLLYNLVNFEINTKNIILKNKTNIINKEIDKRLSLVIEYINDNYLNKISLDSVASISGFSKSHLFKLFKDKFNYSPYHYYMLVKINKAEELIKKNKTSITEIALELGFSDIQSFSKIFKKYKGISPKQVKN